MSDLDRLIRFAAVAEELSFSRAAKRLRVDQPWLSRQIQQLESQLGFPLFIRSTRKVSLTSEGEALFPQARELMEAADKTRGTMRNLSRSYSSVIAFGLNPYCYWVPARQRLLDRFAASYPAASVELVSNYSARLLSKLRKRSLDVALIPAAIDVSGLESIVLHRSKPSLLVPSEHPLARQKSVAIADLAGVRIAITDPKLLPSAHEQNIGPFIRAGAVPVVISEGQAAIPFYAIRDRLVMVSLGWPDSEPALPRDFVHVALHGEVHDIEYILVRRQEPARGLLNQFWNIARQVTDDLPPPSLAADHAASRP